MKAEVVTNLLFMKAEVVTGDVFQEVKAEKEYLKKKTHHKT